MRRKTAMLAIATAVVTSLGACGGDGGDGALPPLVPDPAVVTTCAPGPVAAGGARAKPVACAEELIPGRLAVGRVGDLLIENAHVRAIVRGPGEGHYLHGLTGGGLVDAARVGGEDLIKEIQPTIDLNVGQYAEIVITEAGDDGPATIVVRGRAALVPLLGAIVGGTPIEAIVEHHWLLPPDAHAIEMRTILRRPPGTQATGTHALIDGVFVGGRVEPFMPTRGFTREGTNNAALLASRGTTTSYGLVYAAEALPSLRFVEVEGLRLAFGPDLTIGDAAGARRWLVIGDGSIASVTERGWALRGVATGKVEGTTAPGVEVVVRDADDQPITIGRAGEDGRYAIALPSGSWVLKAEAKDRLPGAATPVTVQEGAIAPVDVPAGAKGAIEVHVRDPAGMPLPARVVLEPQGADRRIHFVGASGDAVLRAPPGSYRVSVSRGVEYDAHVETTVVVPEDGKARVDAVLTRVVDTAGWISLDPHLHSEMSNDSTMPLEDRILAVAAEGIELPISTDHDFVTDYGPVIQELGLGAWVATAVGEEASSVVWGHINAWPLVADRARTAQGAVPWYGRAPGEVFALLRDGDPVRVVQVNHPRRGSSGLFDRLKFDPVSLQALVDPASLGLPADADLNDLSFDAVEVGNRFDADQFEAAFADWLALVGAGHPVTATGSSDSHGASTYAGESRTYVWVGAGADDPASVTIADVNAAIRARHVVVSQGAFVVAGLRRADGGTSLPGELVDHAGRASATLAIRVQAPPWMPLLRVRVYERTDPIATITLDPADTAVVRYDGELQLPLGSRDTFYVVRVEPAGRGDPVLGMPVSSFTNPVLVDVDGDGTWTP